MASKTKLQTVVLVGASVVGIGFCMMLNKQASEMQREVSVLQQEHQKLQETVVEESDWQNIKDVDFAKILEKCKTSGDVVAESVNMYAAKILEGTATEDVEQQEKIKKERQAVLSKLRAQFVEDAEVVGSWYEGNSYDNMTAVWQFEQNYTFDATKIEGLWTCRDEKNKILAYAKAVYDVRNEIFKKPVITVTSYGNAKAAVTMEGGVTPESVYGYIFSEDVQKSVSNIFDAAQNNKVEPGRTMTEEEEKAKEDAFSARDQLKEQWEKENGGN